VIASIIGLNPAGDGWIVIERRSRSATMSSTEITTARTEKDARDENNGQKSRALEENQKSEPVARYHDEKSKHGREARRATKKNQE
jgi:hypothetical protein